MTSIIFLCQIALFTWFLWLLVLHCRKLIKRRRDIRQRACLPTRYLAPIDILGLRELKEVSAAFQSRKLLDRACSQYLRYGTTFTTQSLTQTTFHTIDPENIEAVLSSSFSDYGLGWRRKNAFRPLLGRSLFQLDGDSWSQSRALLHGVFRNMKGEELRLLEDEVQFLFKRISPATAICQEVDLAPHFFRLSANVAASLIHGTPGYNIEEEQKEFLRVMEASGSGCEKRWQLGIFNPLFPQGTFNRDRKIVHAYVQKHVDRILTSSVSRDPKQQNNFLAALSEHTKSAETLRDEACMLYIAATDTVGCTLTNMFFMIGRNPQVWEKLRREVDFLAGKAPNAAQLKQLVYHGQCVKESLRLYPAVASNSREACKDTILPVGGGLDGTSPIFVPSGSFVRFSTMALQRRKDIWGEDADEFRPERWEKHQSHWSFIPFQQGPRICLGHEIAMNEITYVLARMVQQFRSCTRVDEEPWVENVSFGISSADGARVKLVADA